ncbi:MAG: hypothetical protein ACLQVL_02230 [Terriglobia bacterium]
MTTNTRPVPTDCESSALSLGMSVLATTIARRYSFVAALGFGTAAGVA